MIVIFYEECTLEEVLAYRELENEYFDFGEGDMKMTGVYGSEDAYYEMDIENYIDQVESRAVEYKPKTKIRKRTHPYYRKKIDQRKMRKLRDEIWWGVRKKVSDNGDVYYKRDYVSSRRKWIRKRANKKVRKTNNVGNHGNYRRVYEFWWDIW